MSKKVFVTGGHGFLGSWVVKQLLREGYQVRCLVRKTSKTHRIDELDVEKVVGDILERDSLIAGMEGCAQSIHLAGISAYKDMQEDWTVPTIRDGTANVFDAALEVGLEKVVYIGSGIVYASRDGSEERVVDEEHPFELHDSGLLYAIGKHEAEKIVDQYVEKGLHISVAIPMETYGPHDHEFLTTGYLKEAINSWPALATAGGVSFAHSEDVADGIVKALQKGGKGERYILGGENLPVSEIIRLCLDVAGKPKPVVVLPTGLTKFVLRSLDRLGLPTPEHPNAVDYGTTFAYVTSEKAKKELGYSPRPSREVMKSTVDWLRREGHIS